MLTAENKRSTSHTGVPTPTWVVHSGGGHFRHRLFSSEYGWGEVAASREQKSAPGRRPFWLLPSAAQTQNHRGAEEVALKGRNSQNRAFVPVSCGRWGRFACLFCGWASHRTWACRRMRCRPGVNRNRRQRATSLSHPGRTGKNKTRARKVSTQLYTQTSVCT